MKMSGNHILITGGATGIGFSMAKYLHAEGNRILICGRRADRLAEAAQALPGTETFVCDVAQPDDRAALFSFVTQNFSEMNILVNNAGIQRDIDLTKGVAELDAGASEIRINIEGPIYLSALFTPMLAGRENAAIVNVSSGLALEPGRSVHMPIYTATKGALHNFSVVQRTQLEPLGIRVIEILPPAVISELNLEGRTKRGTVNSPNFLSADEYVEQTLARMAKGEEEIRYR